MRLATATVLTWFSETPLSRRCGLCAVLLLLVDPRPGLAAAEHAAEGAALHPQLVLAPQRDRRLIVAAGVGIVNPPVPLLVFAGLHVDQHLFAIRVRF